MKKVIFTIFIMLVLSSFLSAQTDEIQDTDSSYIEENFSQTDASTAIEGNFFLFSPHLVLVP